MTSELYAPRLTLSMLNFRNVEIKYGLLVGLILWMVSCQSAPTPTVEVALNTAPIATERPTPPKLTVTPTPFTDSIKTLTFWTVEDVSSSAGGASGSLMRSMLRGFERKYSDIKVDVVLKKPNGKGGMIDFLRTAKPVAPMILPDIAIMNGADLEQAFLNGSIVPLDNRLDRTLAQDLLPAARKIGTVNNQLLGVPIGLEMQHLIYNTKTFTTPPLLWDNLLTNKTKYVFPAKGLNGLVNNATLSQYFSAGGILLNEQGRPKIDSAVLQSVLSIYQQALELDTLNVEVLELNADDALWQRYVDNQANIAQVTVEQYLTNIADLPNTSYTSIPVQKADNIPIAITNGWVIVLVTEDINRQRMALNLLEWFLSTSNNVNWNKTNHSIPTLTSAYQVVSTENPAYWLFLNEQLNTAMPQPNFTGYDQIGRILQQAVQEVLSGEVTPEQATKSAVDALAK